MFNIVAISGAGRTAIGPSRSIARVQSKAAATSAAAASLNVVFDSPPTAGNLVVIAVGVGGAGMDTNPNNATGYDWVGRNKYAGSSVTAGLHWSLVGSGASATMTVTFGALTSNIAVVAAEYSGFSSVVFDQTAEAVAASTSPASGATDTTAAANELWIGALCQRGTNPGNSVFSSPTNSFSIVSQIASTSAVANADRACALLERIVSSTGTANAGATAANDTWAAIVGTFQSRG